ncbi:transcriptional regulator, IclR family [Catenulispora acidiphila DSM 44928]|uniref:Glycerol operon regulatory protein n=1 Tax=Catenulispora acidiphila (strain DSM 44928 / JCM 14897 / NBRC 102108 / NRRL B-24433 / ID139908) TaxID=479433 RepID=C7PWN7_CATAD|nr:IclR family transcriptional regulator [Catenulispora acidiphila]ACU75317.1 transcriptional regulator, IclR family [Catenulispora acidiphila DSM 44928]
MTGQESATVGASQYRERNSTADRALDILGLFSESRLSVSGQEVATALGAARSTAYRYLQSLVASGFLEEDPAGGFRLGVRILELARLARRGYGLSEIALPVMNDLCAEVGETVLLTRRSGSAAVCIERCEAQQPVRISYERGSVLPANAGASALALLAWLPEQQCRQELAGQRLQRFTARTITDVETLMERLAKIRRDGYSVSRGELDTDILGIAAPVRGASGEVVAAVSIAALEHRVPDRRLDDVVTALREAAELMSSRLAVIGD